MNKNRKMTKQLRKEYEKAKKIVEIYENEERHLNELKIKAFKKDLKDYFNDNLIDGEFKLKKFELKDNYILPIEPYIEEYYEGGNDKSIEEICKKHNVNFRFHYMCVILNKKIY